MEAGTMKCLYVWILVCIFIWAKPASYLSHNPYPQKPPHTHPTNT